MGAEAHFGLRRQSEATTALFHSGVILWCIERQVIAKMPAELSKEKAVWRCASHRTPKTRPYRRRRPIVVSLVPSRRLYYWYGLRHRWSDRAYRLEKHRFTGLQRYLKLTRIFAAQRNAHERQLLQRK